MAASEKEKQFLGRGGEAMDLCLSHALGSEVWDMEGKRYIDFHGASGVGILGWGKEEIELAIRNSDRPSYVFPHFHYKAWTELAELLATITPEGLERCFRTTGGSEGVEAAMQIAMMYTGRKKFLSVAGSYHGNTLGALSLGASENRKKFHNLLPGCEKIELPLDEKELEAIERKLKGHEFAAIVMEPVICNLGVLIPEPAFMERLDHLCKSHGTLLVMDEVITGFGRTGKLFASEHYHLRPDILVLAKAMSAGHAGIGAVITTEEIGNAIEGKIGLYSSYGWHPISVDATITSIRYLLENVEDLFSNSEQTEALFESKFTQMGFRPSEVRIKGSAIGLELHDKQKASELRKACLKEGLIIGAEGSSLVFFPALNIPREITLEGLRILESVIRDRG